MKKVSFILSLFFLLSKIALSQDNVKFMDKTMSLGNKPSFYVEVEGYDEKNTSKAWEDFIKQYGKSKYNKKAKEYFVNKVSVPGISGSNQLDIYTKVEGGKSQSTTFIWVDLGGAFANPTDHKDQSTGIKNFINDFYVFARKRAVGDELKAEEKKQKDLEKDLSKLETKNSDLHKEIEKLKERIKQAENDIVKNLNEQDDKKVEIKKQQKVVESVVDKLNSVGKVQ
ncbi:MAG TPA: hypothetical protein PKD85_15245 [Saprospiraceae bacterium]|nr:hypothetical protein [Saprospiraceae bacterium]